MNNDLISRSALKKAIEEYRSLNCISTSTIIGVRNVFYLIDNAPTIEFERPKEEEKICQDNCDKCEHGVPIDGQFYDDGRPIHECGIRPVEKSEQEAKQYALGYQDGFLDAKRQFERVEADDCEGCKYEDKTPTEFPCSECKHSHLDKFEWKEAKPYERPKPHPAAFCDGDCVHCKIMEECEKADGGES